MVKEKANGVNVKHVMKGKKEKEFDLVGPSQGSRRQWE